MSYCKGFYDRSVEGLLDSIRGLQPPNYSRQSSREGHLYLNQWILLSSPISIPLIVDGISTEINFNCIVVIKGKEIIKSHIQSSSEMKVGKTQNYESTTVLCFDLVFI